MILKILKIFLKTALCVKTAFFVQTFLFAKICSAEAFEVSHSRKLIHHNLIALRNFFPSYSRNKVFIHCVTIIDVIKFKRNLL